MTATARDHERAHAIATGAGELLLDLRARLGEADPDTLRAEGDRTAHTFIVDALARDFPGDAVLSEEGTDDAARLDARRVWIVDPLDGTREFGEGRDDWAVHVALVVGGRVVAAAVAIPGQGITLDAQPAVALAAPHRGAPRLLVSRTRPPALAEHVADALGGTLVPLGSAGVKATAVVLGDGDVYLHEGGQHEWDSAAPVGVALAAGAHASRIDGSPLVYNRADTWLPDLLVCRPELADAVLAIIAAG